MEYETQTLSHRPDRRPMGRLGARDPRAQARRPAPQDRHARGPQRHLLPHPRGLHLAGLAPRLPPVEDRLQLLRRLEAGRHLGPHPDLLRVRLRKAAGREPRPASAASTASRSRPPAAGSEVGTDGGKKVRGRKRHIVVDTLGLLLAVVVTAANVDDAKAAQQLFAQMPSKDFHRLEVVQADNKYHSPELDRWLRVHHRGYEIVVVSRQPGERRFVPLKSRWVVERTFAWLGRYRRLSKDYEHTPEFERSGGADRGDSSLPPSALPRRGLRQPTFPVRGTSAETGRLRLLEQTLRNQLWQRGLRRI